MRRQALLKIMKRHQALVRLILGLLIVWWPAQSLAADLDQSEMAAIQGVVQLQINALAKDDADSAFALTTADTRNRLGTADNFLRLIKEQYDPVYRHRLALFSVPQVVNGKTYQVVRLTDLNSHVWVAIYLMNKDTDGAWKIDGCQLLETTTIAV